jgi:hypothetical protein
MIKLFVKPDVFKEQFTYMGKTYYLTLANKCLVSHIPVETCLPIFHNQNNFCEVISKREYREYKKKYEASLLVGLKKRVQLTLI